MEDHVYRLGLVLILITAAMLYACSKPALTPTPTPSSPNLAPPPTTSPIKTPQLAPAEFEVVSLAVTPIVAEPGQTATVEAKVMNIGEMEGSHTLTLTVDGMDEETRDARVAPGATETITFTMVKDVSGLYDIEVAGLTDTLRVRNPNAYPRLANYYCHWSSISLSQASSLAKWDLIVIRDETINISSESIELIRKLNPNIKILVWISAGLDRSVKFFESVDESWYLHYADTPSSPKPPQERRIAQWTNKAGNIVGMGMNPASDWASRLAHYVNDKLISSGLIDGVFYDYLASGVRRDNLDNLDIDNDGIADDLKTVMQEYQSGMSNLLKLTRELLGPEAIIFGNPGVQWRDDSPYWEHANGHMQENALGTQFGSSWPKIWEIYQRNMQKPSPPPRIHWIAVDTNDEVFDRIKPNLPPSELQKMRFGLAIALLGDGYFGFDQGSRGGHGELWWFPEYDANLGLAKGDAQERGDGGWIREFDNGVVIANPTSREIIIEFPTIYKDVTTGNESSRFVVAPEDGRIFLR